MTTIIGYHRARNLSSGKCEKVSGLIHCVVGHPRPSLLWPEFREIKLVLDEYLNEAAARIIREEVYGSDKEPQGRSG